MKWNEVIREGATRGNTNPPPVCPKPTRQPGIDYRPQSDGSIHVLLMGKVAGTIRRFTTGWQYFPKGSRAHAGKPFDTLEACKRSLESD